MVWLSWGIKLLVLRNTRFCYHEQGWRCPDVSLKTPTFVTTNIAGNAPTSHQIFSSVTTNTPGKRPFKIFCGFTLKNDKMQTRAAITGMVAISSIFFDFYIIS